jgi:hypothetical protein
VQQIERDGFQRCQTYVHVYTTLKFLALQGATHIYDISWLRVNVTAVCASVVHCNKEHVRTTRRQNVVLYRAKLNPICNEGNLGSKQSVHTQL